MSATYVTQMPRLSDLYAKALARLVKERTMKGRPRSSDLPDVSIEVASVRASPRKLAAYQRMVGESVSGTLPAGYVHVLSFPLSVALMNAPAFPISLFGLVHLSNEVEYLRPLHLGETFTLATQMVNLRAHRRGLQVDAVAEARLGGEVAWRGVSTYLARDAELPSGVEPAPVTAADSQRPVPPELPTAIWRLGADTGRKYAAVSGDGNPIHLSSATARMLGFKQPIAHGMYSAARALAAVGAVRTERYRWTVEFGSPVYLPATVALAVTPREQADAPAETYAQEEGSGAGWDYVGWNQSKERVHFSGAVVPEA